MRMIISVALLCSVAPTAVAKEKHHHKAHAHEHGVAKLDIASEDKTVLIQFEGPGDVVFGFEHAAKTKKEKEVLTKEIKRLNESPQDLFILPQESTCTLTKKEVSYGHGSEESEHKEKGHKEHEEHEEHSDLDASFTFQCKNPVKGKTLKIALFKAWPHLKKLNVQVLSSAGQKGLTLTNDDTALPL